MAQFSLRVPDSDVEKIDERTENRSEWIRGAIAKRLSKPDRTQLGDSRVTSQPAGLLDGETVRDLIEDRAALRAQVDSKDDLLADRADRIDALEADKRTLDARLNEANERLRHANAQVNALRPAETSNGPIATVIGRLFGR